MPSCRRAPSTISAASKNPSTRKLSPASSAPARRPPRPRRTSCRFAPCRTRQAPAAKRSSCLVVICQTSGGRADPRPPGGFVSDARAVARNTRTRRAALVLDVHFRVAHRVGDRLGALADLFLDHQLLADAGLLGHHRFFGALLYFDGAVLEQAVARRERPVDPPALDRNVLL